MCISWWAREAQFVLQLDACLLLPVYGIHGLEHHLANVHKGANCRHELVLDVIYVHARAQHQDMITDVQLVVVLVFNNAFACSHLIGTLRLKHLRVGRSHGPQ